MRKWCLVIDASSPGDAGRIGNALADLGLDLEVEDQGTRVLCFAESETAIRATSEEIRQVLLRASLWAEAVRSGRLQVWSEQQHGYVDPPPRDEDLGGADTSWTPDIDASAAVRAHIRERGGSLYVWFEDVGGGGWAVEKVSSSAPTDGREFDEYDAGDFTLFLEKDFRPPIIKLRLRRWWPSAPISLRTGLEVHEAGSSGEING